LFTNGCTTAADTYQPANRYIYDGNRLPMTAFEDITLTEIGLRGMYQFALFGEFSILKYQ